MYTSNALLKNDKWTIAPRVTCDNTVYLQNQNHQWGMTTLLIFPKREAYLLFYKAESATMPYFTKRRALPITMPYFTKRRALPWLILQSGERYHALFLFFVPLLWFFIFIATTYLIYFFIVGNLIKKRNREVNVHFFNLKMRWIRAFFMKRNS